MGKRHFAKAELRQWFKALYEVLLGSEQGPRMGAFIKLYGRDNVVRLIERALAGEDLGKAAVTKTWPSQWSRPIALMQG